MQSGRQLFLLPSTILLADRFIGSLVPCGHVVCASCTFKKFKKLRNADENVQLACITCESVVTRRPIRVCMVENVVKRIPRVNDEERRRYEEEARGQGFIGENSWSLFFK